MLQLHNLISILVGFLIKSNNLMPSILRLIIPVDTTSINIFQFLFFSVRPEKPVIKMMETGESVEGYLGPYQIGSSLSLVCQVNGGKLYD